MLDEVMRIAARGPQLEPSRPLPPGRLERFLELPFGVVDGLALCHLVAKVRQDFRVVAMSTLCRMPEVRAHVLPINFANTRDAVATSARSRAAARALASGSAE